jgi:hypothetical protein
MTSAHPLTQEDLKRFQLAITHVIAHPNFGAAFKSAITDASSTDGADTDALSVLGGHGISLPSGATASVSSSSSTDSSDPDTLEICVVAGGHLYCVDIRPPIVIDIS